MNGYTKTIIVVAVTCTLGFIGYVVASDVNSRDRDTKITGDFREADRRITENATEATLEQTKMNGKLLGEIKALNITTKTTGEQLENVGRQLERIANNGQ